MRNKKINNPIQNSPPIDELFQNIAHRNDNDDKVTIQRVIPLNTGIYNKNKPIIAQKIIKNISISFE